MVQGATGSSCGDAGVDCGDDYWLVKVGTAQIFFCLSIQTYDKEERALYKNYFYNQNQNINKHDVFMKT